MGKKKVKYLLDSNIIIYHLNGDSIATRFILKHQKDCAISQITFIEVLSFDFTKEEELSVKAMLNSFAVLDIDSNVSAMAVKNRKLKKIRIPDNIIASTAQIYNLTLVTRNSSDFASLDLKILDIHKS